MIMYEKLLRIPEMLDNSVNWSNYLPDYKKNNLWLNLEESVRLNLRKDGVDALKELWPNIPTTLYLDFFRTGNRTTFESLYFRRRIILVRMVQAYCAGLETDELLDGIIDGIGSICEEFSWIVPAHNWPHENSLPPGEHETVDLFAANTSSLLALTIHLLKEPLEREVPGLIDKVCLECKKRCLIPFMENDTQFWMGFHPIPGHGPLNNWNPWITANFLHTLFLIPCDNYSNKEGVARAVRVLNNYLDTLSPDGGCNEGPAYWNHATGSLFDCLDILSFATDGSVDLFKDEWFTNAVSYLERMHIHDQYFVDFADCSGKLTSLPSGLIGRIADTMNNRELKALSLNMKYSSDSNDEAFSTFRLIRNLFFCTESSSDNLLEKRKSDCFPDLQIGILHDSKSGLHMACKGGNNDESHNHNDVGHFIIYGDGHPLVIDPGVGDYTRETFNHLRYTIWSMQSGWHNLPRINGLDQKDGKNFHCDQFNMDGDQISISMSEAYPEDTGLSSWKRKLFFNRDNSSVELTDTCSFCGENNNICWNFIFLVKPEVNPDLKGSFLIHSPVGTLTFSWPADRFLVEIDSQIIPDKDDKMGSWGVETIWRIRIKNMVPLSKKIQEKFLFTYKRTE